MQSQYTLLPHANLKANVRFSSMKKIVQGHLLSPTNIKCTFLLRFPLYTHVKGRGRERDGAELTGTFCPVTNRRHNIAME